jgi:hypothetical protein
VMLLSELTHERSAAVSTTRIRKFLVNSITLCWGIWSTAALPG